MTMPLGGSSGSSSFYGNNNDQEKKKTDSNPLTELSKTVLNENKDQAGSTSIINKRNPVKMKRSPSIKSDVEERTNTSSKLSPIEKSEVSTIESKGPINKTNYRRLASEKKSVGEEKQYPKISIAQGKPKESPIESKGPVNRINPRRQETKKMSQSEIKESVKLIMDKYKSKESPIVSNKNQINTPEQEGPVKPKSYRRQASEKMSEVEKFPKGIQKNRTTSLTSSKIISDEKYPEESVNTFTKKKMTRTTSEKSTGEVVSKKPHQIKENVQGKNNVLHLQTKTDKQKIQKGIIDHTINEINEKLEPLLATVSSNFSILEVNLERSQLLESQDKINCETACAHLNQVKNLFTDSIESLIDANKFLTKSQEVLLENNSSIGSIFYSLDSANALNSSSENTLNSYIAKNYQVNAILIDIMHDFLADFDNKLEKLQSLSIGNAGVPVLMNNSILNCTIVVKSNNEAQELYDACYDLMEELVDLETQLNKISYHNLIPSIKDKESSSSSEEGNKLEEKLSKDFPVKGARVKPDGS